MKPLPPTLAVVPLLRYRRVTLPADATVEEARRLFLRHPRLYHLPIVDAKGITAGFSRKKPSPARSQAPPSCPLPSRKSRPSFPPPPSTMPSSSCTPTQPPKYP
jgi:CBS domain-containing protein